MTGNEVMSQLFINRDLGMTLSNFRPISVVPIIAKILEKLVASQLNTNLKIFSCLTLIRGPTEVEYLQSKFCYLFLIPSPRLWMLVRLCALLF